MADYVDEGLKKIGITISKPVLATICIIAGLMVILLPSLLVWIVGLFLMVQGALLLTEYLGQETPRRTATVMEGIHCRSCGARNMQQAVYCKDCGKRLVEAGQTVKAQPQEIVQ